jgi:hypothetical protein
MLQRGLIVAGIALAVLYLPVLCLVVGHACVFYGAVTGF